jgi:hypothetical protein
MANINWRTINIDALDPDSPANFDLSSLTPAVVPVSTADVQNNAQQIRQLLRGGDNEGALQGALENPPYGADDKGKVRYNIPPHHHVHQPLCRCSPPHWNRTVNVSPHPGLAGHSRDRDSGIGLPTTRTSYTHYTVAAEGRRG